MTLRPGTQIGPYEVSAALGAGGMGEVYRARDTNLDRDVAIKVLPETFGQDPDGVARLRREAHVLAALNHPHIASIYGLEEKDEMLALATSWSRERTSPSVWSGARFPSTRRSGSPGRSWTVSTRPTRRASSTATSSPVTSS